MKASSGGAMLLLLGGVIGVLIGVAIGVTLLSYAYPVFQSDKWATWVQAIGSVVMLAVAIGVAWYQGRSSRCMLNRQWAHEEKTKMEADARKLNAMIDVCVFVSSEVIFICKRIDLAYNKEEKNLSRAIAMKKGPLAILQERVSALPIQTEIGVQLYSEIVRLQTILKKLEVLMINNPGHVKPDEWSGVSAELSDYRRCAEKILDKFKARESVAKPSPPQPLA